MMRLTQILGTTSRTRAHAHTNSLLRNILELTGTKPRAFSGFNNLLANMIWYGLLPKLPDTSTHEKLIVSRVVVRAQRRADVPVLQAPVVTNQPLQWIASYVLPTSHCSLGRH